MKEMKKVLAFFLCFVMVLGFVPASAFAALAAEPETESTAVEDTALTDALAEAKTYIDGLTINNSSNDPATVVSTWEKQFTWDNENRESADKSYLFEWSYYNGVVFEGLDYIYDVTGDTTYAEYVEEYLSTMITSDGGWATCTNNASKPCAGYNANHGADCYKTASLLMDYYKYTGEDRYLKVAKELYEDLTDNQSKYISSAIGGNYKHTWSATSNLLWLDGLYMSQPFMAEYASATGDAEELQRIADRFAWVSENMYDEEYKLHYHAASSADSNSGDKYWLRANGWYAAAMVDVMDYMTGSNLTAMQAQLKKLVDGIAKYQDSTGMWRNAILPNATNSDNRLETSGTALIAYAIMKGVNNGWLDSSYAEMAQNAFVGICEQKLNGKELKDICFKGNPGGANNTFYNNEGKGVGPFIMLYAEVLEYQNDQNTLTGITVTAPTKTAYEVGEDLDLTGMVVTAAYRSGKTETVTDYTVSGYDSAVEGEQTVTVTYSGLTATFTVTVTAKATEPSEPETEPSEPETEPSEPDESATLTGIVVTSSLPAIEFLVGDALSVSGVTVRAIYSDGTSVTLDWDETGANGYTLSGYDMNTAGDYTVIVSYGGYTETFKIKVWNDTFTESAVTVKVNNTGISGITVGDVDDPATIESALEGVLTNYVAYDIELAGYVDGNFVTVTLPIPEDVTNPGVFYVSDDGTTVTNMNAKDNGDGTMSFVTNHFSTYVTGEIAEEAIDWIEIPGENKTIFRLTNSLSNGQKYVIVSRNQAGPANAVNLNGTSINSVEVTVIADSEGNYIEAPATTAQWNYTSSRFRNVSSTNRYLRGNNTNLSTTTNTSSSYITWSYNNNNIRVRDDDNSGSYRYLHSDFTTNTSTPSSGNRVYIYVAEEVETESVWVGMSGAVEYVITNGDYETNAEILAMIRKNLTVYTATSANGAGAEPTDDYTITGTVDPNEDDEYTLTVQYDGVTLGEVTVEITTKAVKSVELVSSVGTVYVGSEDTVRTGAQLRVTYDNDDTELVYVTVGMLSGDFTTAKTGVYRNLTVTYNGNPVEGSFTLNVIEKPDMNYPEYPDPGAINVEKYVAESTQFQNTGVAEINLTTSGLPAQAGVDVILVADISNSMAWFVNAGANGEDTDAEKIARNGQTDKWDALQESAETFIDVFLRDNEAGKANTNTVSFVTFGGYDRDRNTNSGSYSGYADSVQTHFVGAVNASDARDSINGIEITGSASGTTVTYTISGMATGNGTAQGGTNYDFAFAETAQAITALKEKYADEYGIDYDESGREIYVLFMTDGAPDHYNQLYYKTRTNNQFDYYAQYLNAADIQNGLTNYLSSAPRVSEFNGSFNQRVTNGYYLPSTDMSQTAWENWLASDSNAAAEAVLAIPGVESITSIGFDLAYGGFGGWTFGEETLESVLTNLAGTNACDVMMATSTEELNTFYASLASELKMAATNAYYVDQMGDGFDIQMASTITKFEGVDGKETTITLTPRPQITISTYTIYTPDDVGKEINGVTVTRDMIGQRYGGEKEMEVVTFNDDGTEAYSNLDVDGDGDTTENIISGDVIYAKYFWYNTSSVSVTIDTNGGEYNLPAETFYWNIGTINNQEFVMSYYVYLEGSAEGQTPAGTYQTNNYATLYYTNWLGNDAQQGVQSPALAWESASVYYGFYLVDKDGNPVVNRATGETGTFDEAVKVTSKIFHEEVKLNDVTTVGATIEVVSTMVPDGYTVYDENAVYTITIDSSQKVSGWVIKNGKTPDTTYVTDYRGGEATNATNSATLDQGGVDYTATTVWFAVVWEPSTVPDVVVIDYGLPVDISVLENDMFGTAGTLIGVGALADMPVADASDFNSTESEKFGIEHVAKYGTATLNGNEVRYTPSNMQMSGYDKFAYEVLYTNANTNANEYYYGTVTVIPATTIYYEDSFVEYSSDVWSDSANNWVDHLDEEGKEISLWTYKANDADEQAEDRPGEYSLPEIDANNLYGYDGAYSAMTMYSMNGFAKATVDYDHSAVAEFDFYGTGFDVVSLTNNTTGTIIVEVFRDGSVVRSFIVDTYYGYKQQNNAETGKIEWVVDPDSSDSLYQVPVMKISGLDYAKYHAVIRVIYDPLFDHTDSDTYDFYLDAIRIYDPANDGKSDGSTDTTIEDAYVADGEGWPMYQELRNNVLGAGSFDDLANTALENAKVDKISGLVFIDGDAEVDDNQFADYRNFGPNNELYLAPGQEVAFMLDLSAYEGYIASVQIGIKSANADELVRYEINNISKEGNWYAADVETVATSTDMYYDITRYSGDIIVISNNEAENESGILSLTNIKVTFTQDPATISNGEGEESENAPEAANFLYMTERAALLTLRALNSRTETEEPDVEEPTEPETEPTEPETEPTEPETEPTEPETYEPKKLNVYLSSRSVKVGNSVIVTITTDADVQSLTVNGKAVTRYTYSRWTGTKTWVATVEAEEVGEMAIDVVAYNAEGLASAPVNNSVTVTQKANSIIELLLGWLFG